MTKPPIKWRRVIEFLLPTTKEQMAAIAEAMRRGDRVTVFAPLPCPKALYA